jgi:membrane protein
MPGPELLLQVANQIVSFSVVTVLFAMIFKILPDIEVRWRDVWIGAVATALVFTVGKFGLGLYLGRTAVGSAYGAAGSLVVVLVWAYYSNPLFGRRVYANYTRTYGSRKRQTSNVAAVTEQASAEQALPASKTPTA